MFSLTHAFPETLLRRVTISPKRIPIAQNLARRKPLPAQISRWITNIALDAPQPSG